VFWRSTSEKVFFFLFLRCVLQFCFVVVVVAVFAFGLVCRFDSRRS